ncbi:MAG: hypothetical protein K6E13_03510 [Lachnospiraceae bacterium]|nr:hypothetical protein [Lachnospiraceae bacterium]
MGKVRKNKRLTGIILTLVMLLTVLSPLGGTGKVYAAWGETNVRSNLTMSRAEWMRGTGGSSFKIKVKVRCKKPAVDQMASGSSLSIGDIYAQINNRVTGTDSGQYAALMTVNSGDSSKYQVASNSDGSNTITLTETLSWSSLTGSETNGALYFSSKTATVREELQAAHSAAGTALAAAPPRNNGIDAVGTPSKTVMQAEIMSALESLTEAETAFTAGDYTDAALKLAEISDMITSSGHMDLSSLSEGDLKTHLSNAKSMVEAAEGIADELKTAQDEHRIPKNTDTIYIALSVYDDGNEILLDKQIAVTYGEENDDDTVAKTNISTCTIDAIPNQAYTGAAITPGLTIHNGDSVLTKGTDYSVSYSNNTNVGTATATVTGKGNYEGSATANFTIVPQSANFTISSVSDQQYTGKNITPSVTVKVGSTTLTKNVDYTLSYSNNKLPGKATITVNGIGSYTGTATKNFNIKCKITKTKIAAVKNQLYNKKLITPNPKITIGNKTLKKGTDYTLSYKNNRKKGKATITIKGKGYFTGTTTTTFKIVAKTKLTSQNTTIKFTSILNKGDATTYTGKEIKPKVLVKCNGTELVEGEDYTVKYLNNKNAGTARVKITGINLYSQKVYKDFTIKKAKWVIDADDVMVTYSTRKQTVRILSDKQSQGIYTYRSSYLSNYDIAYGKGKISIPAKICNKYTLTLNRKEDENYLAASKKITVSVAPPKTKITSIKNSKSKTLSLKFKEVKINLSKRNPYDVRYDVLISTKSNFKFADTYSTNKTSLDIKKLKKGQTYYVKVRTRVEPTFLSNIFKEVYSDWSDAKKITITK